MEIRTIEATDYVETKKLIQQAFKDEQHSDGDEAFLVERLRKEELYQKEFEIIALVGSEIVGHGLLSPVFIEQKDNTMVKGVVAALAPLAVKKEYQGKGIGRALIAELENRAKAVDYQGISILGNPDYYQRVGYFPAGNKQLHAPFDIENSYYLIKELKVDSLVNYPGTIRYLSAFGLD